MEMMGLIEQALVEGSIQSLEQENAKLRRLLAHACCALETVKLDSLNALDLFCEGELRQWYEEHKKQDAEGSKYPPFSLPSIII
jgi:hypothetical protein